MNVVVELFSICIFLIALGMPLVILIRVISSHSKSGTNGLESTKPARHIPAYRVRDDFLSRAELGFYHTLRSVVGERAVVLTKVNLGDLVYASKGDNRERYRAWQRINRKHVDYVLCEPESMVPLAAIELDDSSHLQPDRQKRDEFVDSVMAEAELPIYHFRLGVESNFDTVDAALTPLFAFEGLPSVPSLPGLAEVMIAREAQRHARIEQDQVAPEAETVAVAEVEPMVEENKPEEPIPEWALYADAGLRIEQEVEEEDDKVGTETVEEEKLETKEQVGPPICPRCGSVMVKRVAQFGPYQGSVFWGCPNYPHCRGVRQVDE